MDFPCSSSVNVQISSAVEELWRNFNEKTNEMIINNKGRKMFPTIEFKVSGLHPEVDYVILIKFMSDRKRYRYSCQEWTGSRNEKFKDRGDAILHSDGAQKGQKWMEQTVTFDFVRLTNDQKNKERNNVFLQSMHKYRPVLEIYSLPTAPTGSFELTEFNQMQQKQLIYSTASLSRFEILDFIAVTAYQNREVNDLKKEFNKYASAFKAKEMKEKEKKEEIQRNNGGMTNLQNFPNPYMYGQYAFNPQFNPYLWKNPAMMGQFGTFGQMQNQFAPGPNATPGSGNIQNMFGSMPGFPGFMSSMTPPSTQPTNPQWPQGPPMQTQAPPTSQMPSSFTPPVPFPVPGMQQAPPLTPTSSNQSSASTAASPVDQMNTAGPMTWPNYYPNMMNYGMVPQGKPNLDLQNTTFSNYNPVNNNNANPS